VQSVTFSEICPILFALYGIMIALVPATESRGARHGKAATGAVVGLSAGNRREGNVGVAGEPFEPAEIHESGRSHQDAPAGAAVYAGDLV
jgi:hypothetical protein